MKKRATLDASSVQEKATPKSVKKVARLEDVQLLSSAKKSNAPTMLLQKVLGIAKFELRDSVVGAHPVFVSSAMDSTAKVRECYAKNLAKMADEPKRKQFFDEFLQLCASDSRFPVAFLSPFQLASKENAGRNEVIAAADPSVGLDKQDSLFRIFVQSPQVQKELIDWTLELLPTEPALARLALNNLRWLNNIHDSEGLARKLMECLAACDPPLQREIIHAIPEVVDDLGHKLTMEGLQKLMQEDPSFTGVILDTYSSLNMSASIVTSIRDDLLKRIGSISTEYLPSALKFLLQTTPTKALGAVVGTIRTELDLSRETEARAVVAVAASAASAGLTPNQIKSLNFQRLSLEALKTAMSFDEHICNAFLTSISAAKDNKSLDFWILLIAHGLTKMRTKVETIIRKKVISHDFSNSMVRRALAKNGSILIEQFPAVLAIADKAVRATEPVVVEFGVHLYCCAFNVFPDIFNRQNLISNVLSHVGSATSDSECGAGLNILVKLAEDAEQLKELWQFVETVLDNLASLSKVNLRKAWKMFTALIWKGNHGGALDDKVYGPLCMVLRKQLTNMRDPYKRSGVIGAAAMIGQLSAATGAPAAGGAARKGHAAGAASNQDKPPSPELAKEFEFHLSNLMKVPEPLYQALAMDELALALQAVPLCITILIKKVQSRVLDSIESFVSACTEKSDIVEGAEVLFNLNGAETTTAMNFWSQSGAKTRDKLVCLCPALNLAQVCIRKTNGNLNDLGALNGAPLLICPPNWMETMEELPEADQTRLTFSIFHAINWIRECLNTFCEEPDVASNSVTMQRLTQMYMLEEQLEKCLRIRPCALPNLRDPTALLCSAANATAAAEPVKKKAKAGGGNNKSKKKKDEEDADGGAGGMVAAAAVAVDTGADLPRVRLLASSFRSLILPVANVLKYPSSSEDANDCAVLRPFALHALLQTLDEYCQQLFETHAKRTSSFGRKPKEVDLGLWNDPKSALTKVILHIVPALGENLSRLGGYISNWVATQGTSWTGPADGSGLGDAAEGEVSAILPFDHDPTASEQSDDRLRHEFWWFIMPSHRLIFDIFTRIFVWLDNQAKVATEDEAKNMDSHMRAMMSHICGRKVDPQAGGSGSAALSEMKKECWTYLSSLSKSIQSLPTAVSFAAVLESLALYGAGRKFAVPSHANTPIGSDAQMASDALVPASERAYLNELSKHCLGFLRTAWTASSGGMKAADVKTLIEKAVLHSNVTSKAVRPIVSALQIITEFSSGDDGNSGSHQASLAAGEQAEEAAFGTLTKSTVSVFHRTTFACLGKLLKQMALEKKILSGSEEKLAKLSACTKLNQFVKQLIELVKAKKSPAQLRASALREGKVYLELMQRSMPFFGHMAALESKKTVECLKLIEDGSRVLQRLCNQAKEEAAVTLLPLIPGAKKCIEKLVIETCRIVESAGLSGALRFGPLKHKNLKGDVMPSQVTYQGAPPSDAEEDEEEDVGEARDMDVEKQQEGEDEEQPNEEPDDDEEVANSDE